MKFKSWLFLENKQSIINQGRNILKKMGFSDEDVERNIQEIINFVKDLNCQNKNQFIPIAALFYNNKPVIFDVIKKLSSICDRTGTFEIRYDKGRQEYYLYSKQYNNTFYNRDFIKFMEWVDGEHHVLNYNKAIKKIKKEDKDFSNMLKIASSNNIDVYEVRNIYDAIKLGHGYDFCISSDGPGNAYYTYRMKLGTTFYFVFDRNRDISDPLHIVIIGVHDENNPYTSYTIDITDAKNTTGKIDHPYRPGDRGNYLNEYLKYLENNGINTNIFVNKPITQEEIEEFASVQHPIDDLERFKELNTQQKINYVRMFHQLTPEQLEYIIDEAVRGKTSFKFMLELYLDIGYTIPDFILYKLYDLTHNKGKGKQQWIKTYLRKRKMTLMQLAGLKDQGGMREPVMPNWFEIYLSNYRPNPDSDFMKEVYIYASGQVSDQMKDTKEYANYIQDYICELIYDLDDYNRLPNVTKYYYSQLCHNSYEILESFLNYVHHNTSSKYRSEVARGLAKAGRDVIKNTAESYKEFIKDKIREIINSPDMRENGYAKVATLYIYLIEAGLSDDIVLDIAKIINESINQEQSRKGTGVFPPNVLLRIGKFKLFDAIPAFLPENKPHNSQMELKGLEEYMQSKQHYYNQ